MAQEIKAIQCPKCGSTQKTEIRPGVFVCTNCGTEYYLDNDDININVRQVPPATPAPAAAPAKGSALLGCLVVLGLVLGLIFGVQWYVSQSADSGTSAADTPAAQPARPLTWHSPTTGLLAVPGGRPVLLLAGQRDSSASGFGQMPAVGFYDARTGKLLKLVPLPALPAGEVASPQLKQFSTGAVDVLYGKQVYAADANHLSLNDITQALLADAPQLSSGLADIGLGNGEDDMFYVFTNDGHHYNLYPLTHRLYTNDELGPAQYGPAGLRPGSPISTSFAFSQASDTYPDDPIQLVRYQYRDNGAGPKLHPRFEWDDDFGGSGIFTDADPHVKRLITPYWVRADRLVDYHDFTPGRQYFDPAMLYADDDVVLITLRPTAANDSPLEVQALDARTAAIRFTTPLPATAGRPNMALRYAGGFVIGRGQQTYNLSTTGQLTPGASIP